jgi:hypothetical protein
MVTHLSMHRRLEGRVNAGIAHVRKMEAGDAKVGQSSITGAPDPYSDVCGGGAVYGGRVRRGTGLKVR